MGGSGGHGSCRPGLEVGDDDVMAGVTLGDPPGSEREGREAGVGWLLGSAQFGLSSFFFKLFFCISLG